jgi:spore coat protein U-like protein
MWKKWTSKAACTAAVAVLAVALPFKGASAATATATLGVTASVQATCAITGGTLAFGTYAASQVDASTTISVQCTNTTPWTVTLDPGTGTGATDTSRKMTGPSSATLNYQLYKDSGRTQHWGADNVDGDAATGTGNGSTQSLTVYGRVFNAQYVTPGSYSDTVTATVAY